MRINPLRKKILPMLTGLVVFTLTSGVAQKHPVTTATKSSDWIYYRHLDIYFDLLTNLELPQEQRKEYGQQAYQVFFEYWILHRSNHARFVPVAAYEESFARLLKKYAEKYLVLGDPLRISPHYKDGKFIGKPKPPIEVVIIPETAMLPQVEGLPGKELKTWAGYQQYVSDYRKFFNALVKPRKR